MDRNRHTDQDVALVRPRETSVVRPQECAIIGPSPPGSHCLPIHVICEEGVTQPELAAAIQATRDVLRVAGVGQAVPIRNYGLWREEGWRRGGELQPYRSVDWYVERGRTASTRADQVNASEVLDLCRTEPWRDVKKGGQSHYDLVVLGRDMYSGSEQTNFVIGLACRSLGTVVSVNRFRQLSTEAMLDCIATETMHELGHVFGLIPDSRVHNVEESLGKHCTNTCTMRQGLRVPADWIAMTRDRLRSGVFCAQCHQDLRTFFS